MTPWLLIADAHVDPFAPAFGSASTVNFLPFSTNPRPTPLRESQPTIVPESETPSADTFVPPGTLIVV